MEIFGRSRRQLTLIYSLIMCIFLVVLIFVVRMTMEWAMFSEQAQEILDAADSISDLRERYGQNPDSSSDEGKSYKSTNDRLFFYIFDEDRRLVDFAQADRRFGTLAVKAE